MRTCCMKWGGFPPLQVEDQKDGLTWEAVHTLRAGLMGAGPLTLWMRQLRLQLHGPR